MRILVTGASGFVGRRLCAALIAAGHEVVAPVRNNASRAPMPAGVRVEAVTDPLSTAMLAHLLSDVHTIVHLAARVHIMKETASDSIAEFRRVNVEGTRAVVNAARAAGTPGLLFVSSIKVHGEGREQPYSEADVPLPKDPYGQSKLEAEGLIRSLGSAVGWTILRPPLVYGPGVGGNFRRLLRLAGIASRWPLPLGGLDNLRSMIFVDNLAGAIVTAISNPATGQKTFLVSDDHDVGVSELIQRLAMSLGGRARLFRAPPGLLQQAARLLGREADLDRLVGTLRIDCHLIRATLGWRPPVDLDAGLALTAQWWRSVGAR